MEWFLMDDTLRNVTVRFPIVALVRDIKISDALTFPGIFCSTYMVQIEWYLIEFTLRNVSVRYDDYG